VQSGQTAFCLGDLIFHLAEGVLASQQIPISVSNPPPTHSTFAMGGIKTGVMFGYLVLGIWPWYPHNRYTTHLKKLMDLHLDQMILPTTMPTMMSFHCLKRMRVCASS
jgi:hypothetical protein